MSGQLDLGQPLPKTAQPHTQPVWAQTQPMRVLPRGFAVCRTVHLEDMPWGRRGSRETAKQAGRQVLAAR